MEDSDGENYQDKRRPNCTTPWTRIYCLGTRHPAATREVVPPISGASGSLEFAAKDDQKHVENVWAGGEFIRDFHKDLL